MSELRISKFINLAVVLVVTACGVLLFDRFNGDALIYLPFAQNASHGDFFSFNPGVFSSGSTSPLWPFLLAPAFWFSNSVVVAKCIAYAVLAVALWDSYRTVRSVTGSPIGGSLGLVMTAFFLTIPGMMMFESALLVLAVYMVVRETQRIAAAESISLRATVLIGIAWCVLPLIRPDGMIVVAIDAAVLSWFRLRRHDRRGMWLLVASLTVAMIPAAGNYGYSFAVTGNVSESAAGRSLLLLTDSRERFGGHWSLEPAKYLFHFPVMLWIGAAVMGWLFLKRTEPKSAWNLVAAGTVLVFAAVITVVVPVTSGLKRYVLLVVPFVAVYTGYGIQQLWQKWTSMGNWLLVGVLIVLPLSQLVSEAWAERNLKKTFAVETVGEVSEYLNTHAPSHASLLTYEVQERLSLRPDIFVWAYDGLTDGKIFPYMNDLKGYLAAYRPTYILSYEAPGRTKSSFMEETIFAPHAAPGDVVSRNGMTFTLLLINPPPYAHDPPMWLRLYRVQY